mgnify:FL=1
MQPKIKMVLGHPKFAYVELAEARPGRWQLRWQDSRYKDYPRTQMILAGTLEEAEFRAEAFLCSSGVFEPKTLLGYAEICNRRQDDGRRDSRPTGFVPRDRYPRR